jgi:hypothetical protein
MIIAHWSLPLYKYSTLQCNGGVHILLFLFLCDSYFAEMHVLYVQCTGNKLLTIRRYDDTT